MIREKIQESNKLIWYNNNCKGTLALATGTGKSKIAVDVVKENKEWKTIFLVVPTEKLRDENWKDEFKKWNASKDYYRIERICYASMAKTIVDETIDLVILDEAHNLTEANSIFFKNNKIERILGLTATPPEDEIKKVIFKEYCPVLSVYSLDEGVKDGIIAPYEIVVIECRLDNEDKYIKGGSKDKPFLTTEQKHYEYLSKKILQLQFARKPEIAKWAILERMRFIYKLKSKTKVAKSIVENLIKDDRSLIFCGGIEQAEELCKYTFHSKSSDKWLNQFIKGKINHLSSIRCLNEGMNIPLLESALIVQINSKEKDIVQRIGRIVRMREGHLARIYVLSVINTVDEVWTKKALSQFNPLNITYSSYKNFVKK